MQANYVQRIRLKFGKRGAARYTGHLDLARALERALNRSRLPVSYTQGYNRRPRVQFANALPLGFTSSCELADVWLQEKVDPQQARAQLADKMPPGLDLFGVWDVPLSAPAMQADTVEAVYQADLGDLLDAETLQRRVTQLLAADEMIRERRGKKYDLRPLVLDLTVQDAENGAPLLTMRLSLQPGQTGRPDELLSALGVDPLDVRVHRSAIVFNTTGAA